MRDARLEAGRLQRMHGPLWGGARRSKSNPTRRRVNLIHRLRRVGESHLSALLGACGVQAQ